MCECLLLLAFFLVTPASGTTPTNPASEKNSEVAKSRIQATFLKAPLHFEANQGQTDEQVKFVARGGGYSLFLTATEAVMELRQGQQQTDPVGLKQSRAFSLNPKSSVLRMNLVGANTHATVAGLQELSGKANYFISNDANKWTTNISTYAKVEYRDVYPGVNLVYYGNQGKLEYDFVVSPGSDPGAIKIAFEGAEEIKTDGRGDLIIRTAIGDLHMHKPLVYQEVAGVKKEISGEYVLSPESAIPFPKLITVGLHMAAYDATKPLVIDPVLSYSTYLTPTSAAQGIAVDSLGNVYIAGGSGTAFITKLDPAGALVYSTQLGGAGYSEADSIAIDSSGNICVVGTTSAPNFPTVNAYQPVYGGGGSDAFVAKLAPNGSTLLFSTFLGGSGDDHGTGCAMDGAGNAYISGYQFPGSSNFPIVNGYQPTFGGGSGDGFFSVLSASGSTLLYSTYLGGGDLDAAAKVAVDLSGKAYVSGYTFSGNFPTKNAFQSTHAGAADVFVAKFDITKAGNDSLLYSTFLGGSDREAGYALAVDAVATPSWQVLPCPQIFQS